MTMGVPLISKNCFEGTPFLPAGAMRVPRPAAGMMTVTFIRGEKYNNFTKDRAQTSHGSHPPASLRGRRKKVYPDRQ